MPRAAQAAATEMERIEGHITELVNRLCSTPMSHAEKVEHATSALKLLHAWLTLNTRPLSSAELAAVDGILAVVEQALRGPGPWHGGPGPSSPTPPCPIGSPGWANVMWIDFKVTRTHASRNKLVHAYLPLVKAAARSFNLRPGRGLDRGDLEGYGVLGLIEAIERFPFPCGVPFEAFASPRVRGAMLDALRASDVLSRRDRENLRRVDAKATLFFACEGRSIDEFELAAGVRSLSNSEAALPNRAAQIVRWVRSSSIALTSLGGDVRDARAAEPLSELVAQDSLNAAYDCLGEIDRQVITLYYREQKTLREIGRILGYSESRICQLRRRGLRQIRSVLPSDCDVRPPAKSAERLERHSGPSRACVRAVAGRLFQLS